MINLLTFDIEEWFQTTAMSRHIARESWERLESRVRRNTMYILEVLAKHQTRATFFILGWIAERHPGLVREIEAGGHEVASHGYGHRLIAELGRQGFREEVRRSKEILEELTGQEVVGHRAASFSVTRDTLWALEILREAGYRYDASMFPIRHDIYGINGVPRFPFRLPNGLVEVPASTLRVAGRNLPFGGGGYFRFYPYWLTRQAIRSLNARGQPAVIYLHPWELDPESPLPVRADLRTRFRQGVNLRGTRRKLECLLREFRFQPVKSFLDRHPVGAVEDEDLEAGSAEL